MPSLSFYIQWVVPTTLVIIGFAVVYRIGLSDRKNKKASLVMTSPGGQTMPIPHNGQVEATEGHELQIQVEKGTYTRCNPVSLASKQPFTIRDLIDPNPMLHIAVTAKFTPIGTVPVQTLELHSNGQVFKCINMPSPVFDHEAIYTLGFEASRLSVKPALGKGANPSYIRAVTPIKDVMSNSFVLESAE